MTETESIFEVMAKSKGYTVLRRGWPDFAVMRADGSLFCVEVKSNNQELTVEQVHMIDFLALAGISCYVSRDGEFPDLTKPKVTIDRERVRHIQAIIEAKYLYRLEAIEEKLRQIRKLCED